MNSPFYGKFRVTQTYKGNSHKGIDLVGVDTKEIHATVSGIVEFAGWDMKSGSSSVDPTYGLGQYVRIKGDLTGYKYYFGHLSIVSVSQGQRVKRGEVIGTEGSTGHSTGSHTHYEIRRNTENTTFLNPSEISGIPNQLGTYTKKVPDESLEEAKKTIREKAGLIDMTIDYLEEYKFGEELIRKLAAAMS